MSLAGDIFRDSLDAVQPLHGETQTFRPKSGEPREVTPTPFDTDSRQFEQREHRELKMRKVAFLYIKDSVLGITSATRGDRIERPDLSVWSYDETLEETTTTIAIQWQTAAHQQEGNPY